MVSVVDPLVPYIPIRIRWSASRPVIDRKSTRLNSSHITISYAVFCLKKKTLLLGEPLDLHRDTVGHLLVQLEGELLADHFRDPERESPIGELLRRVERRGARQMRSDRVAQIPDVVGLERRERYDGEKVMPCAELRQIREQSRARAHAIDLVCCRD